MIIIITGGIGSGKTLSIIKDIVTRKQNIFTNFDIKGISFKRLKYEHIIKEEEEWIEGKIKPVIKTILNYEFWQKQKLKGGFDVFLDEFHNVMNSRRSMSKKNVLMSDWLSQIRKILGDSERNNLYVISQKLKRIDVNCRDLAHMAIKCEKQEFKDVLIPTEVCENGKIIKKRLPLVVIWKKYFRDADALSLYEMYGNKTYYKQTRFIGNPYYKYYDSYELIDFGSDGYI